MAIKSFKSLISQMDEASTVITALLHAIEDHGGSEVHFNQLVADAKAQHSIFDELAKQLVGGLWYLTKKDIKLDFRKDLSFRDFKAEYPHLVFGSCRVPPKWEESDTALEWHHTLYHWTDTSIENVILSFSIVKDERSLHANWFELVDYVCRLSPRDFSDQEIVALGSLLSIGQDEAYYPVAYSRNNRIHVEWRMISNLGSRKGQANPKTFYLIRRS